LDYLKENSFDLVDECGYKDWDEATEKRVADWIQLVVNMCNPATTSVAAVATPTTDSAPKVESTNSEVDTMMNMGESSDDLPF
jgi:hypothetical protein